RILANLELGRRRVVNNLQYTYPNATLARSNWTINAGEAVCQAGGVYFARRLRLVEGDVHRVYIRALTAAGAPQLAWRADGGEFATAPLVSQRLVDSTWTDYGFDVPAGEYFYLRVQTPLATRIKSMVACNTLHEVRVLTAPVIVGQQAVPGQPVSLLASAQSRLVGGHIARFDVSRDGVLSQWPASNNSAVITLTFQGAIGETRSLVVVAVDDLGNRSAPTVHTITLADDITPAAPSITSPVAGATSISLSPVLSASAFAVANASHASTDWQIRAADGQSVVWQSLADTSHLTSISVPGGTLLPNTSYQAWVRYHTGSGVLSAWGHSAFTTVVQVNAPPGEVVFSTPGTYTWTVPDGVTSASALVVDGSGGDVAFGPLAIAGNGFSMQATSLPAVDNWSCVCYGNGQFMAVATGSGAVAISPDGVNWTSQALLSGISWASICYGNGLFVAISNGPSSIFATSADGLDWNLSPLPGGANWRDITYGNGTFVMVSGNSMSGGSTLAATSEDGFTWTLQALPASMMWKTVCYGEDMFVALASNSSQIAASSPDGVNWAQRSLPAAANWRSVDYGNGIFVAISDSNSSLVAVSTDGLTWQVHTLPVADNWRDISYGNGVFVAMSSNGTVATTVDGIHWTQQTVLAIGNANCIAYGNGRFVALGFDGDAATLTAGPTVTHADATLTSSNGFSLTAPTSAGSYGVSSGVAAYDNDMPLTPGAQITVTVPGPDGAVRVIWGAGRSFPNNAASAGTQIGIVLVAEGGGAGQWQRVDGNFNPVNYPFGGAFFNSHPTYAGIVDQTIDGQAMVKVPKFWFKTGNVPSGQYAGKRYWMISDQPAPGFAVHPAFMNYGAEVPQYWLGKYQGTADGGKLGSQAGLMPLTNLDFPTMQARAVARNVYGVNGFMMWSIYQLAAVQMLCLIEMGSSDSQTVIGSGNVDYSGMGVLSVNHATVATATWRGIVGLWGNVLQMVDGLQSSANAKYMIWDKNGNRSLQTSGQVVPQTGYATTMATAASQYYDLASIFAASNAAAYSSDGAYGDSIHLSGAGIAWHGGASHTSDAGLFYLDIGEDAAYSADSLSTRLAKY
ncbi:hypothetical protein, partial [Rivicola pingtungensis]